MSSVLVSTNDRSSIPTFRKGFSVDGKSCTCVVDVTTRKENVIDLVSVTENKMMLMLRVVKIMLQGPIQYGINFFYCEIRSKSNITKNNLQLGFESNTFHI